MLVRSALAVALLAPLLGLAQDAADARYEEVLQKLLDSLGQITKTLETVTDDASAQAARPELRKQSDEFRATRKKSEELAPPAPEVRERVSKKYRPEFEKVQKQLTAQAVRVQLLPGGRAALEEIRGVLERDRP